MNTFIAHCKYGGILALLAIGSFLLFVWPPMTRRAAIDQRLEILNARTSQAERDEAALVAAEARLADLSRRVELELREIPREGNAPWLHRSISQSIESLPLQLVNLTWGQETAIGTKIGLGVNIETTGGFDAIFALLERVEAMPRLVRVDELKLVRISDGEQPQVRADLKLKAFHQASEAKLGAFTPER